MGLKPFCDAKINELAKLTSIIAVFLQKKQEVAVKSRRVDQSTISTFLPKIVIYMKIVVAKRLVRKRWPCLSHTKLKSLEWVFFYLSSSCISMEDEQIVMTQKRHCPGRPFTPSVSIALDKALMGLRQIESCLLERINREATAGVNVR